MSHNKLENKYYFYKQALCGFQTGCGIMITTLGMGYTSPAIPQMIKESSFAMTLEQGSWIVSVLHGAAAIGAITGGPLVEKFGRRPVLLWSGLASFLSWLLISYSSSVTEVILARLLSGLSVGIQGVAGMVYSSEIIQANLRPIMGIFPGLMGTLGFLIVYVVGETTTWRQLAFIIAGLCTPLIMVTLYLPESPVYGLSKGNDKIAIKVLTWLRESPEVAHNEYKELKTVSEKSSKGGLDLLELTRPPYKWPVSIAILLMMFQQFTGITVVMSYMTTIFDLAGAEKYSGVGSIIIALINIISAVLNGKLLMEYDRRYLLYLSSKVISISFILLSSFFCLRSTTGLLFKLSEMLSFIPLLCLVTFTIGFSFGWGMIPFVFLGEGLTSNVRGIATSLSFFANSLASFVVTKSFTWGIDTFGPYGLFMIYTVLVFFGQSIMNRSMPETRNKSMLQMEELYQEHAITWYKNKIRKLT